MSTQFRRFIKRLFGPRLPISSVEADSAREKVMELQSWLSKKRPNPNSYELHEHPLLEQLKFDLSRARSTLEKIMTDDQNTKHRQH